MVENDRSKKNREKQKNKTKETTTTTTNNKQTNKKPKNKKKVIQLVFERNDISAFVLTKNNSQCIPPPQKSGGCFR